MKPVLSTPSWSRAHKTKRSGKHGHVGFYASICMHLYNPSGWTSGKSPTYELTPLTWLPINRWSASEFLWHCCPPEFLGTCDFASSCRCENHSRSVWLNPLMPSGQSRDFLGLDPSPNSVQFFLRATPPLVRRLCHVYPLKFAYAGLGTFQSTINMVTYSTTHSI
jgi:hypothetical protein